MQRAKKLIKHWLKSRLPDIERAEGHGTPATPSPVATTSSPVANTQPEINPWTSFRFVTKNEASQWISLPPGKDWAFHSAVSPVPNTPIGYLHHASYRLTTTSNIFALDLEALIEKFEGMPRYDEYTEVVVIGPKNITDTAAPDSDTDPERWVFYFIDHFNRRVMSQKDFEKDLSESGYGEKSSTMTSPERSYREWMESVTSDSSHYYRPSPSVKKQCLGRKIAQQIVWDYQTRCIHSPAHVIKDADIEGSFSISDCSSLLSALQKKRVSDKQCQKMIRAVIHRFLHVTIADERPKIAPNFDPQKKIEDTEFLGVCGMILFFLVWTGPLLRIPVSYHRQLQALSKRADNGEYVPDLWKTFVKGLLKEWNDLNIVLALILSANVAFLALPGTSDSVPDGKSPILADVSRAAGIISMFMTMSGTFDAYRYIIGPKYKTNNTTAKDLGNHNSFTQLAWMASFLGMPLVLLLWSVIAFVVSAVTWIFLFSATPTQISTTTICGVVLVSPIITLWVFRGPTSLNESVFSKMPRGQPGTG
ncbi:hypothetical protein FRC12_024866 [Ceratobasidium sp. 428]|nr:hypothetical protein FRC12_024866 [Ceratobasidium sp. 428]